MNVLITLSARVQKDSSEAAVGIGPESSSTMLTINPLNMSIFYRGNRIKEYVVTLKNNLMQLVSGFDNKSTFLYSRASHKEFDVDQLMPATIFTICDYSHNQGYGSKINSSRKLASRFLPANFSSSLNTFSNAKSKIYQ